MNKNLEKLNRKLEKQMNLTNPNHPCQFSKIVVKKKSTQTTMNDDWLEDIYEESSYKEHTRFSQSERKAKKS